MSRDVLISIRPEWVKLIAEGKKTIEVRKNFPREKPPFKCYIYETKGWERVGNENLNCTVGGKGRGAVIGEFICDGLYWALDHPDVFAGHPRTYKKTLEEACLTDEQALDYSDGKDLYGWHISELVIYKEPKTIREMHFQNTTTIPARGIYRPPQGWCYVEEMKNNGRVQSANGQ